MADNVIRTDLNRLLGVGLQWLKMIFYDNVSIFLALLHTKSYIAVIWCVCVCVCEFVITIYIHFSNKCNNNFKYFRNEYQRVTKYKTRHDATIFHRNNVFHMYEVVSE
jgi:hypothetical protein